MNISNAIKEVEHIGLCYFADQYGWITIEQILDQILSDVLGNTNLFGLKHWTDKRDGLRTVVAKCEEVTLNQYLLEFYGIDPVDVGGSRKFFTYLAEEIDNAIQEIIGKILKDSED